PAKTKTDPKIQGLVGKPSTWRTGAVLYNVFSPKLKGYRANWAVAGQKKKATEQTSPVDLRRGWNVVTQQHDGEVRSFLVFGGERPKGKVKKGAYSRGAKAREPAKKDPKPGP